MSKYFFCSDFSGKSQADYESKHRKFKLDIFKNLGLGVVNGMRDKHTENRQLLCRQREMKK